MARAQIASASRSGSAPREGSGGHGFVDRVAQRRHQGALRRFDLAREEIGQARPGRREGPRRGGGVAVERLLEDAGDPGANPRLGGRRALQPVREIAIEDAEPLVEDTEEQLVLRLEMPVERLVREPGPIDDGGDVGFEIPGLANQREARIDQLLDDLVVAGFARSEGTACGTGSDPPQCRLGPSLRNH